MVFGEKYLEKHLKTQPRFQDLEVMMIKLRYGKSQKEDTRDCARGTPALSPRWGHSLKNKIKNLYVNKLLVLFASIVANYSHT